MSRFFTIDRFRFVAYAFVLIALPGSITAQPSTLLQKNVVFDQIPQELGLTQATINCVLQDREGYLWIATWSGLIRYDGYSTTVYHSSRGAGKIKSNKITTLFEDASGRLWVGTHMEGLFQYNRNDDTFIHYSHDPTNPESISNNKICSITEDKDGNLWVGTEHGLNLFDGKHNNFRKFFHSESDPSSLSFNDITDVFYSSVNELWIATKSGLNRLVKSGTNYTFERYFLPETTNASDLRNFVFQIREMEIDGNPSIWCSTMKGLAKWDNGQMESFAVPGKPSPYSFIRCILPVPGIHLLLSDRKWVFISLM